MNDSQNQALKIFVKPAGQQFFAAAEKIALRIGGALLAGNDADIAESGFIIHIDEQGISLQKPANQLEKPIYIDFASKKMCYRQKHSGSRKEAIARAVGMKTGQPIKILDATAGLGGDGFILASLGAEIILLERNPLIYLLLDDAISRARCDASLKPIMQRMELIAADAINYLDNIAIAPQVIYLDPMFPDKSKSARSKKEMRLFREIAGADADIEVLFSKALKCATKRVVIKKPLNAAYVGNAKPHCSISGTSCRFDVYMT